MIEEYVIGTEDRELWMRAFDKLPPEHQDIHWLPEYVEAHQLDKKGFARIVECGEEISFLPFMTGGCSPYGYGGLVGASAEFHGGGGKYRFHPLIGEWAGRVEKHIVALDLACDDLRHGLSKGHRSAVRRAEKLGVDIGAGRTISIEDMSRFGLVYEATMERQSASDGWRHPVEHFWRMYELMGDDHLKLFFAFVDGRIESGCIILHGFNTAYYHFSGSYMRHPKDGVNHFMVLRVAEWAKEQGYRWLHLGGGVTSDQNDPLLTFKKGFGGKLLPVHVHEGNNGARTH